MKKFLKYSICSVFLLFCVHTVTHGQMVPASIVQTSTSVTGTPRQTGNDLFSNNDMKEYDHLKVYNTFGIQLIDRDFNATAIELNFVKNELMNYNSGLYIIQLINENRVERTIKVINQQN
ncbi:MAG TPA: T9SS type A sorting domain-containing protein [Bacteroidia bacterium]|nr:T9SS type A sorting domain-containing protein [Bacteroidia bacterium]